MANILYDLTLSPPLAIQYGGTGGANNTQARTNLGLGTLATQNANAVSITGGTIDTAPLNQLLRSDLLTINAGAIQSIGGNPRGVGSTDLQLSRSLPTQVASGVACFLMGENNTASGALCTAFGTGNKVTGIMSTAIGNINEVNSNTSVAMGYLNKINMSGTEANLCNGDRNVLNASKSFITGDFNTTTGNSSITAGSNNTNNSFAGAALGYFNNISGSYSGAIGYNNLCTSQASYCIGENNTSTSSNGLVLGRKGISNRGDEVVLSFATNYLFTPAAGAVSQQSITGRTVITSNATTTASTISLKLNSTCSINISVVARNTTLDQQSVFRIETAARINGIATGTLLGTPQVTTLINQNSVSVPAISVVGDSLAVACTGITGSTIRWFIVITLNELSI